MCLYHHFVFPHGKPTAICADTLPTGAFLVFPGSGGLENGTCTVCTAGLYSSGNSSCIPTPPGTFTAANASAPSPCAAGHYQPLSGANSCSICGAGFFSPAQSPACYACPLNGTSLAGSSSAANCTNLTCASGRGLDSPIQGALNITLNTSNVTLPPVVIYSSPVDIQCVNCGNGTYSGGGVNATCLPAPPGYYVNITNASVAAPCDPGTFASGTSSVVCTPAFPGTYAPGYGNTNYTLAPPGAVCPVFGLDNYTLCQPGYFRAEAGQFECNPASPGFYVNGTGSTLQVPCPQNTTAAGYNNTNCTLCTGGDGTTGTNFTACNVRNCSIGTGIGAGPLPASGCSPCGLGYSSQGGINASCTPCGIGTSANVTGLGACIPCLPGTFANTTASASCTPAPPGSFVSSSFSSTYTPCNPGMYNSLPGQTACTVTPPGYFTNATGMTAPLPCPADTFQANSTSFMCDICPPGYSTNGLTAQTQCALPNCAAGSILNGTACMPCPVDTFIATQGALACLPCGPFTSTYGQTGMTACLQICTYGQYVSNNTCGSCSPGYYQNATNTNTTSCTPCAGGSFSATSGAFTCLLCPAGTRSTAASSACTPCAPGTYGNTTGAAACTPCPAGTTSTVTGATSCVPTLAPGAVASPPPPPPGTPGAAGQPPPPRGATPSPPPPGAPGTAGQPPPQQGAAASPPPASAGTPPPVTVHLNAAASSPSRSKVVGAAVGGSVGGAALLFVALYAAYRYRHKLSRLLKGASGDDAGSDFGGGYDDDIVKTETARLSHMATARVSYAEAQAKVAAAPRSDDDGGATVSPLGGAVSRRLVRNRSDRAVGGSDEDAVATPRLARTSSSGYGKLEDGL